MNLNRKIHEALGLKWGHDYHVLEAYDDSVVYTAQCLKCRDTRDSDLIVEEAACPADPDYTSDAGKVQLLREMGKRKDWEDFDRSITGHNSALAYILILDTTGKLAQLALDWLGENNE